MLGCALWAVGEQRMPAVRGQGHYNCALIIFNTQLSFLPGPQISTIKYSRRMQRGVCVTPPVDTGQVASVGVKVVGGC